MKKSSLFFYYLLIAACLIVPGCSRVVNWAQPEFYQAQEVTIDLSNAQQYIRSISAYDEFSMIAKFDVLWLSDIVRTTYAELNGYMFGKSAEQQKSFLRRQLEENNYFITFFVLVPYDLPLGESDSFWTLFLQIDGDNFSPIELKSFELTPAYKEIFGKKLNRFRMAYQVKFDAKDIEGQSIINDQTKELRLYFRSSRKEMYLVWDLHNIEESITSASVEKKK